ncbi:hypothetical protein NHP20013_13020 [Helicobacter bizzozeronii]|nr:hypothetical protein NHP20013_13020 [Helicobacter bizzozeronii]
MAELKRALTYIAESKGIKDINLSDFNGDTLEFARVLKKLGFGLQSLEIPKKSCTNPRQLFVEIGLIHNLSGFTPKPPREALEAGDCYVGWRLKGFRLRLEAVGELESWNT